MPAAEGPSQDGPGWTLRPLLLGAAHLAIIILIVHGLSWFSLHPSVYALVHGRQRHVADGYQLASALAAFHTAASPRVLIIGPSTAKQGFDAAAISEAAPPYAVINAATSGGTLNCQETLLRAVQRQDVRPDIMVVCLSAMELFDHPLKLVDSGYTDLFDLRDADLAAMDESADLQRLDLEQLAINSVFPAARHRRAMSLHWRWTLHRLQTRCRQHPLDLSRFRNQPYEFVESQPFPRHQVAPDLPRRTLQRELWRRFSRLDAAFVGQPRHFAQLDRILAIAAQQARSVVVVLIPHHAWAREHADALAQDRLLDHLQIASGRFTILDWSRLLEDDDFYDDAHPTAQGRAKVSAAMISFLRQLNPP